MRFSMKMMFAPDPETPLQPVFDSDEKIILTLTDLFLHAII